MKSVQLLAVFLLELVDHPLVGALHGRHALLGEGAEVLDFRLVLVPDGFFVLYGLLADPALE